MVGPLVHKYDAQRLHARQCRFWAKRNCKNWHLFWHSKFLKFFRANKKIVQNWTIFWEKYPKMSLKGAIWGYFGGADGTCTRVPTQANKTFSVHSLLLLSHDEESKQTYRVKTPWVSAVIGASADNYLFANYDMDHLASQQSQSPRAGLNYAAYAIP